MRTSNIKLSVGCRVLVVVSRMLPGWRRAGIFCLASCILCLASFSANATGEENSRTDTFNVVHYDIYLNITNINSGSINGYCTIKLFSKIADLDSIDLDLLQLMVDSVQVAGTKTTYNYNDTLLNVHLSTALDINDTTTITVYYHGQPVSDALWGGFYFTSTYAYNMGVGFAANPHNFGRAWYPCVDNFVDKATYDFYITTASGNRAMCNGLLQGQTLNPDTTTTWHWQITDPLPSYLASVSVSNYAPVTTSYSGVKNTFPVILAAPAADTAKMKASFIHLPNAIADFESAYGPQPFARVGFTEVPFTQGAMEHASNISYPSFAVDSTLDQEALYTHELSHTWWGDMVTCESQGDMWLNEGWATFSAIFFQDFMYGHETYKEAMRTNHLKSLEYAYINDGGYLPLINVPFAYTYGTTVYNKGCDVAHTLRGYLGDSLFYSSLKAHLAARAYSTSNSYQFRDDLTAASGVDMSSFFNGWVFNTGFPHFSIDSFSSTPVDGGYNVIVYLRQKLKAAPAYFNNVPLEITFYDSLRNSAVKTILMSGHCGVFFTTLPFNPVYAGLDMEEKISDARTTKYIVIGSNGNYDFEEAMMTMTVRSVGDSALVRVEHNWVYPDPPQTVTPGLHISQERYWKVEGVWPTGFHADATIQYNGTTANTGGYLDNKLITNSEDSLVLLYRPSTAYDWAIDTGYTLDVEGSATNKRGEIIINNIQPGEYTLAIYDHNRPDSNVVLDNTACTVLGIPQVVKLLGQPFDIHPNPASDSFLVDLGAPATSQSDLIIYDVSGKQMKKVVIAKGEQNLTIPTTGLKKGMYMVTLHQAGTLESKKLVIVQ